MEGTVPGGLGLCKGGIGMWMRLAHRTTGVAVFFFLLVHVTDTALVAAIIFHALNGLRIISVDVWE